MIPLKGWGVKASSWRLNLLVDSNWRAFERGFGSTWIIVNNGGNGHVMAMSYWPTVRVGTLLSLLVILYNLAACWNAAPGTCAYYILNLTKCHTISDFFPPNQRIVIASSVLPKIRMVRLVIFHAQPQMVAQQLLPMPGIIWPGMRRRAERTHQLQDDGTWDARATDAWKVKEFSGENWEQTNWTKHQLHPPKWIYVKCKTSLIWMYHVCHMACQ